MKKRMWNFVPNHVKPTMVYTGRKLGSSFQIKDTNREKAPSNKTSALTKSNNMGIWVVGTSNHLFIKSS